MGTGRRWWGEAPSPSPGGTPTFSLQLSWLSKPLLWSLSLPNPITWLLLLKGTLTRPSAPAPRKPLLPFPLICTLAFLLSFTYTLPSSTLPGLETTFLCACDHIPCWGIPTIRL